MARLRLLNAQAETIPCIVIESPESEERDRQRALALRRRARDLHAAWFAAPDDQNATGAFANALDDYGRFVGDRVAIDHAHRLLTGLPS